MYRKTDYEQLTLELPFGVSLNQDNRWVKLSELFPWKEIEAEYMRNFSCQEGQIAKSARLAFGALYIQTAEGFTDEQTRRHIQENPYLQYFCGFKSYTTQSPFDASMMTYFRKRISAEMLGRITAVAFAEESRKLMDNSDPAPEPDEEAEACEEVCTNKGTLILDATCCPADIHYPTDIGLLNQSRELTEAVIDILYPSIQDRYDYKPRTYRQKARKEYLSYTKKRTHAAKEIRRVIRGQLQYVSRNFRTIDELLNRGAELTALDIALYWKLLVVKEVFRQQKYMYDNKIHQIEDRIVSISQPHIRPIVRGKEHNPTEFGAKVAIGLVGGYAFITCMDWHNVNLSGFMRA
jgi:transposase, IS5 family